VETYARTLFGIAAFLNVLVALDMLFLRNLLPLDPAPGTNRFLLYMTAFIVALFGYAYLRIAQDPRRYRPWIELGVIGKLLAVAAATLPWLSGEVGWRLPFLIGGDLVFAALFLDYLRRTRPA
jgi:hypothetical protein